MNLHCKKTAKLLELSSFFCVYHFYFPQKEQDLINLKGRCPKDREV